MQSQLMREMQQQQLMLAVSQCNQQLMMQQFDMAALQRQLQQLTGQMSSLQQTSTSALLPGAGSAASVQPVQPSVLMPQPYLSPLSSTLAAHVPNNIATSVNVQSSRQTTFTVNPNFTSNPFTSDPQRFPVSQAVQTSTADGLSEGELIVGCGVSGCSASLCSSQHNRHTTVQALGLKSGLKKDLKVRFGKV